MGIRNKIRNLSYPAVQQPCPRSSNPASVEGRGGRKLYLYGFSSCVARLPRPAPCPSLPQLRAPGGRLPSPLVSRCPQATEPQSAHCPEGAGRPGGPWRRITLRPTPLGESFPVHSLWYKIHFSRDGERLKIHCLLLIPQPFPLSLFRFSESGEVKEIRRRPKM